MDAATATKALAGVQNPDREKWDWALPLDVKVQAFASTIYPARWNMPTYLA